MIHPVFYKETYTWEKESLIHFGDYLTVSVLTLVFGKSKCYYGPLFRVRVCGGQKGNGILDKVWVTLETLILETDL